MEKGNSEKENLLPDDKGFHLHEVNLHETTARREREVDSRSSTAQLIASQNSRGRTNNSTSMASEKTYSFPIEASMTKVYSNIQRGEHVLDLSLDAQTVSAHA